MEFQTVHWVRLRLFSSLSQLFINLRSLDNHYSVLYYINKHIFQGLTMSAKSAKSIPPLILILLFLSTALAAQSAFLEKGTNGVGIEVESLFKLAELESLGIGAGYSIAGIMDLGVKAGLGFGELEGSDADETQVAIFYNINILKQNDYIPLSFQVKGFYGLMNITSDYLDNNTPPLLKRGTGFSIGADMYKDFKLLPFMFVRLGLTGFYESYRYSTEEADPPPVVTDPDYPKIERASNIYYGFLSSFLFKTKKEGVLSVGLKFLLNKELSWKLAPAISIAIPSMSSSR